MNRWPLLIFAGALVLVDGSGCQPTAYEPSTHAEAQQTYGRTKWYFARQLAFSRLVPAPGTPGLNNDGTQTAFQLASGTRLIYSEFLPSSGIKAFHGLGRLESLPKVGSPIYRLTSPYTTEHPDTAIVVGFCGERMFRVQAQGTNHSTVLADAVSLATNALACLRNQALHP